MKHINKPVREVRLMAEKLPETRFNKILNVFWGGIIVGGLFGFAALISAIPWEHIFK